MHIGTPVYKVQCLLLLLCAKALRVKTARQPLPGLFFRALSLVVLLVVATLVLLSTMGMGMYTSVMMMMKVMSLVSVCVCVCVCVRVKIDVIFGNYVVWCH